MEDINKIKVGAIVTGDIRTASLFKEAGIDFCCEGYKTFEVACKEKGVDAGLLKDKINDLVSEPVNELQNYKNWDLGFLCDYIKNTHHKYVLKSLPDLIFYTRKIADVHGENHDELKKVATIFEQINFELMQHLKKEEEILFPAIKDFIGSGSSGSKSIISSEIARMKNEHEFAGGAMDKINELTNHYQLPADACNSYRLTFNLLEKFEDDLHIHVHLENNILYPKALEL